jgi:hypothetical protein
MAQKNQQNRNQRVPQKKISVDLTAQGEDYYFSIRTADGNRPEQSGVIIMKDGRHLRDINTDQNGMYFFNVTHPQTDVEQKIKYIFTLQQGTERAEFLLEIPARAAQTGPKKDDPQKVVLIRLKKPNGNFAVFCRVLKPLGYGMKVDVDLLAEGNRHTLSTDDKGILIWDFPYNVLPGEEKKVEVVVDGIEDHAKINLKRLRPRCPRRGGLPGFFDFRTNNGRSRILLVLVAIFWIVALSIGTGPAVINQSLFRGENGLSLQEQRNNSITSQYFESEVELFQAQEIKSGWWNRLLWKVTLLLTMVFLIYGPLSLREEIAEEFSLAVEKLKDREYAQAGDPWYEKLVAWSGAYAVARNREIRATASVTANEAEAATPNTRKGMWQHFPVHLASDAIVEFIPLILKVLFK